MHFNVEMTSNCKTQTKPLTDLRDNDMLRMTQHYLSILERYYLLLYFSFCHSVLCYAMQPK